MFSVVSLQQYLEEALHYLGHALRINAEIRANGGVTRTIQNVDTVVDAYTYNQVGNVLLVYRQPVFDLSLHTQSPHLSPPLLYISEVEPASGSRRRLREGPGDELRHHRSAR